MSPPEGPTLCLVYGPPAVGKLTVAKEIAARTGYRLVHNHVSIDPVLSILGWEDDAFFRTVGDVRAVLFDAAAREGVSIVATYAYARGSTTRASHDCPARSRTVADACGMRSSWRRTTSCSSA